MRSFLRPGCATFLRFPFEVASLRPEMNWLNWPPLGWLAGGCAVELSWDVIPTPVAQSEMFVSPLFGVVLFSFFFFFVLLSSLPSPIGFIEVGIRIWYWAQPARQRRGDGRNGRPCVGRVGLDGNYHF